MGTKLIALLLLVPFIVAFIYAGIHAYRRYKAEGPATYGLAYDEKTGTTHLTAIGEDEDGYDIGEFDPNEYSSPDAAEDRTDDDDADEEDKTDKT